MSAFGFATDEKHPPAARELLHPAVLEGMPMKSLLLASAIILAACQGGERARDTRGQPGDQESVAKPAQELEQDMTHLTSKDGTRIAFDKTGSGPAVILINGALSHRGLYGDQPLAAKLSEHFTVYIYDRRGRGESTDVQPYAVEREIEDIEALLEDAGGSASLYGVSSGAALALQAAATMGPAKVTKLAIYEPPYGQDAQDFARQKQRISELVRTGEPGDAAAFFMSAIGTPPEALEGMKRSPEWEAIKKIDFTLAYDFAVLGGGGVPEDIVKAIRAPTLVMNGDQSMELMHPTADRIAALTPHAQRKTLKGQTHQVAAEAMAPVLVEFFTGSSTRQ